MLGCYPALFTLNVDAATLTVLQRLGVAYNF